MLFTSMMFIGIDPTAGRRPILFAALDQDLRLVTIDSGSLDEVTAFIDGQQSAYVSINGPRMPSQGLMAKDMVRQSLYPPPPAGRWKGSRVADYQLFQMGIRTFSTPAKLDKCPGWMQRSFTIFNRLKQLGFVNYPNDSATHQIIENYPHASFSALLGQLPFDKNTLEGRVQRQLVLYDKEIDIPDPMRFFEEITRYKFLQGILPLDELLEPEELDALVAAYTAYLAVNSPEQTCLIGHPEEGQIVLPTAELETKYT